MVEELQEKGPVADKSVKRRRLGIALAAIFIIVAFLFVGWQMGWFGI